MLIVKSGAVTAAVGVIVAVLFAVISSPTGGVVVALNTGFVFTDAAPGVIGKVKLEELPTLKGTAIEQVTVRTTVLQLQPLLTKLAGVLTPVGKVTIVVIVPVAAAVPILATVT